MPNAAPQAPPRSAVRLIDNWKSKIGKLWSVRVAVGGIIFWGALSGLWAIWPAFVDWLPLWFYAVGGVLMSVALAVARVLKQPGIE